MGHERGEPMDWMPVIVALIGAMLNLLKQQGFQVTPQNENDPGALLRMVLQSGQVFQNRLPMAQQAIMQALAGRR